jgi:RNA:NAD 2'-phosphotransferase (TPT1/KptA family)
MLFGLLDLCANSSSFAMQFEEAIWPLGSMRQFSLLLDNLKKRFELALMEDGRRDAIRASQGHTLQNTVRLLGNM